jgi:two-component sensor histidine kinase
MSLARGHGLLTRNAWRTARLTEVFEAALSPFAAQAISVNGTGREARVKPDLAVNLVMVLNELATNAGKYGALSTPGGQVSLNWSVADGQLRALWRERGGPSVHKPRREGFGSRLMRSALSAFGGRIEVRLSPEGLECEITAPVEP